MDDFEAVALLSLTAAACLGISYERERKRNKWIAEQILNRKRKLNTPTEAPVNSLPKKIAEISNLPTPRGSYKDYLPIDEESFQKLLKHVREDLEKKDIELRDRIPVEDKLAAALSFLMTGGSITETARRTKLSRAYLSVNVPLICESIYKNLRTLFLKFPNRTEQWEQIANGFEIHRQFPLCIGALGIKHIGFESSNINSNDYMNSNGFNSIILMAMCDANYKFTFVDIGCNGCLQDNEVLKRSDLMRILNNADYFFPSDSYIDADTTLPYIIAADDSFALHRHVMKPYSDVSAPYKEIFNERLSRAQDAISQSFRILSKRFHILDTIIKMEVKKIRPIVQACCALHNFLTVNTSWYTESSSDVKVDGIKAEWNPNSEYFTDVQINGTIENIRKSFAEYFVNTSKTS